MPHMKWYNMIGGRRGHAWCGVACMPSREMPDGFAELVHALVAHAEQLWVINVFIKPHYSPALLRLLAAQIATII